MRKLLIIVLLALASTFSFGQVIPGIVASSIVIAAGDEYGDELVVNGDFASQGTGWYSGNGSVTYTAYNAAINTALNSSTTLERSSASLGIELNHTYKIELDVTARTSGSFKFGLGDTSNGVYSAVINATGHYNFELTQTDASAPDNLVIFTWDSGCVMTIDNISIMEVL